MNHEIAGRVTHIAYHPVKGAGALEVEKARLTMAGIHGDRQFMVVGSDPDKNGIHQFVTQRDKREEKDKRQGLAVLALVKPKIDHGELHLTWNGKNAISVPSDSNSGKELTVGIWDDVVLAVDQGKKLSEWMSDHLQTNVRLVKAAGSFRRKARQNYLPNVNSLHFQDGYPIHWFSQESLDELSQIAGQEIPWQTFRPNIVADGMPINSLPEGQPRHVEHAIFNGLIAGIPFDQPKPCDRCSVTNVNQETAEVQVGRALTPLASYKRWKNNDGKQTIIFGENMNPLAEGTIQVGDAITIISFRNPPLVYGAKV